MIKKIHDSDFYLREFSKTFNLNINDILKHQLFYDNNVDKYDNSIYSLIETRIVHWLNFQEDRWFNSRLDYYLYNYSDYDLVIDFGFSVPYVYGVNSFNLKQSTGFIFLDKYNSAKEFFDSLKCILNLQSRNDPVVICDIETENLRYKLACFIKKFKPKSVLIVASEVVEHLKSEKQFWYLINLLKIDFTNVSFEIYITLPICEMIPSHNIDFISEIDVKCYLDANLKLYKYDVIYNPEKNKNAFWSGCVFALGSLK